jgi:hypothetical protein
MCSVTVVMLITLVTWTKGDQPNRLILAIIDVFTHFLFLQYLGSILPSNGDSTPLIGESSGHLIRLAKATVLHTSIILVNLLCVLCTKSIKLTNY